MPKLGAIFSALVLATLLIQGCGGGTAATGTVGPLITSIAPNPAVRGASITISGINFNGTVNTAFFTPSAGGTTTSATPSSASSTTLVVTVPAGIPAGSTNVFISTSDGGGTFSAVSNRISLDIN